MPLEGRPIYPIGRAYTCLASLYGGESSFPGHLDLIVSNGWTRYELFAYLCCLFFACGPLW